MFTFYEIGEDGKPSYPVLYLDTLKVSTTEQTAEEAELKGGKGNATLITWDHTKEITVTLEDALFSAKSMAIMFGNGTVKSIGGGANAKPYIMKTEMFIATSTAVPTKKSETDEWVEASVSGWSNVFEGPDGKTYKKLNPKFYDAKGKVITGKETDLFTVGEKYFCSYDLKASGSVIEVSANSFPGTLRYRAPMWGSKILTNQFGELLEAAA